MRSCFCIDLKESRKYNIDIVGLDNKAYEYDFEGNQRFFEEMESDIVQDGSFKVHVVLLKSEVMLQLKMQIEAKIGLICDRSLEPFEENFDTELDYIYKFGEKANVLSDEMEVIPFKTATINIAQHIYDFIHLSIPMKKLHPKYRNQELDGDDDFLYIYSDVTEEEEDETSTPDPRWEALKNLKP